MVYVSTHAGKRHSISEDTVLVGTEIVSDSSGAFSLPESGFVCVADGVGGNRGGDQASQYVLGALAEWKNDANESLKDFLVKVNDNLIAYASEDGSASTMATTLTGILVRNNGCILIHVGNTRAYIKQGKYLKQVSSDHTTYNWLMSSGQFDAANSCNKNEITNCFGGNNPNLLAKLFISEFPVFSLALLTSDGVHEYVDLDTLEAIITGEGTYMDKCNEIILRATEAGSEDDLSVVIICPLDGSEGS